jgi:predicted XRE-type DNA-binding protein
MSERVKMERGSGNVFADLGFRDAEAEMLLLRSQLMSEVRGVSQSRINDIVRGKVDKLSQGVCIPYRL